MTLPPFWSTKMLMTYHDVSSSRAAADECVVAVAGGFTLSAVVDSVRGTATLARTLAITQSTERPGWEIIDITAAVAFQSPCLNVVNPSLIADDNMMKKHDAKRTLK